MRLRASLILCTVGLLATTIAYGGPQDVHPFFDVSPTLRNLKCGDGLRALGTDGRPLSPEMSALYWKRKQAEDTRSFVHVPEGKRIDLEHPFVAVFDESSNFFLGRMTPETADPFDAYFGGHFHGMGPVVHSTESVGRFWRFERLGFMVLRGGERDLKDHPQFAVQNAFPEGLTGEALVYLTEKDHAKEQAQTAYQSLYGRYSGQGKGRSDRIGQFQDQDQAAEHRTTRFVIHVNGEIVAHIQAQYSFDPSKPLNLETKFGGVPREPGELTVELGRLFVAKNEELSEETRRIIENFGGRDFVRTLLYQRAFSWVNSDAKAKKVIMQVNEEGRQHLVKSGERGFAQWQFDPEAKLVVDKKDQKEWVLSISGENLLKTEEEEMLSLLEQAQERGRKQVGTMGPGFGQKPNLLYVFLRENELPVVARLQAQNRLPNVRSSVEFPGPDQGSFTSAYVPRFRPRGRALFFSIGAP